MGWLSVLASAAGAYLLYSSGNHVLMVAAIIATLVSFWSWGVMHNYATDQARRRPGYRAGFYDFTRWEVESVPNWITTISMLSTLLGFLLFIAGIVFKAL
jgi:hypothetical protein